MATVRAFLRCRVTQPGTVAAIITDVNRLLTLDSHETSQFMTLFYMQISPAQRALKWVRAGHDPALLYHPEKEQFEELKGEGLALGVDGNIRFEEYLKSDLTQGQIILIGTDGLWETCNPEGEPFGKNRVKELIHRYASLTARQILDSIIAELQAFRKDAAQEDDITLVVVKIMRVS